MRRLSIATLLIAVLVAWAAIPAFAQQKPTPFFNPAEMMTVGVYYYPEAWPESQWARDIANIKKLGMEYIHMGEFAWGFMEPEEGKFDFDWLEKNVRFAADNGLKVILCTPSPTPPIWLSRNHPEVLMIDALGRRMNHGSREHACWSVPLYRQYVEKVVTQLGRRFGSNPAVWGWQIDNELSHYGKNYCHCGACQGKFRAWLKQRYGTIRQLNRDWGTAFWSQMYQNFDQIDIPNEQELVAQINPHALLDFQRWFAAEAADYIRFQADLLRKNTRGQWVTTNFMSMHREVDPSLSGKDLDVVTWTIYPAHGNLNDGPLGFRLGDGAVLSFMHSFTRSINGREGLMELQPGQVNWGEVNPWPYPGAIRMWILQAFASGAKLVCTYRYRQPLSGSELYHSGLVLTDGVTPSTGGREYAKAMEDIRSLRSHFRTEAKEPAEYSARRTGFLYSFDNRRDIDNHPQSNRWDTLGHLLKHYKALKALGCPVDVIAEDRDYSKYPFLVAAAYQMVDQALIRKLTGYVQAGGHLVLTSRTGQKDRRGHLWEGPWAQPILELIGAKIPMYDVLPSPAVGKVQAGGKSYEWAAWADMLEPDVGTSVLAGYSDQFYSGKPAATTRKLGKGTVTYIGAESLDGALERDLLRGVFQRAGVAVEAYDPQFLVDWRDGFWVATNFTEKKQRIPLRGGSKLLIGQPELEPAGVAVWTP
jgi:beta-galactosidase